MLIAHPAEQSKKSHHEKDTDPRKDDLGRGKNLKVIFRPDNSYNVA